jgi:hypothetical protein
MGKGYLVRRSTPLVWRHVEELVPSQFLEKLINEYRKGRNKRLSLPMSRDVLATCLTNQPRRVFPPAKARYSDVLLLDSLLSLGDECFVAL